MSINTEINRLINFAIQQNLMEKSDTYYAANRLIDLLNVAEFIPEEVNETLETATPILENMLNYAAVEDLIENTVNEHDLFDTRIMDCVMPRSSEVIHRFKNDYNQSPQLATDNYYKLSIASNYIRKTRIDKNIIWQTSTEYGDLDLTINLSKPEKDPRDIAKAKTVKASGYPKCLLCRENEGYAGHANHPARETHRLIPLNFRGNEWFLQYSPYTYYNEHCIVLNKNHIPMKIDRNTFENIFDFITEFPHYFVGSNADLPIVGGSILSHDHYQGGHYTFAMAKAPIEKTYEFDGFPEVKAGRVKWPMSTIRLQSKNRQQLMDLCEKILAKWRGYTDETVDILAETDGTPHNTITPIGRRRGEEYEFDLVLRNNRTTEEHPLGLFHPHAEVHHIKKENIGLIEVMGLAVLPARLKDEMAHVKDNLLKNVDDISNIEDITKHADWYKNIRNKYNDINDSNVDEIIKTEIGHVFSEVLSHAGVYKRDEKGQAAFDKFVKSVSVD
ncbi:MAG: UDP-glucose--hexose-1-phosphate uridylyltransferase [Selenomonadaceae bacterium]|nr:UDP-glucose--hexose-1-phosphate uridylyltransferase [Selenomonadaceae bacterium]